MITKTNSQSHEVNDAFAIYLTAYQINKGHQAFPTYEKVEHKGESGSVCTSVCMCICAQSCVRVRAAVWSK